MVEQYSERIHTEHAVLDIGQDVGALVIYTGKELLGKEIEVSLKGNDTKKIHTAIHERKVNGRTVFAGVFLALVAGDYIIRALPSREVTITGGHVTEVDWSDIEVHIPASDHHHTHGSLPGINGQE
jgi:hypothetical protein